MPVAAMPKAGPKPGTALGRRKPGPGRLRRRRSRSSRRHDAVDSATLGEVRGVRLRPAAEHVVDGEQVEVGNFRMSSGRACSGAVGR
jgi:hypothetical protein